MRLTTSEARAEACTLLLRLWLRRLLETSAEDARWLRIASLLEAKSIGHPSVTEEVEWLFHNLQL